MQHDYKMDYQVERQYNEFVDKLYDLRLDQVNLNLDTIYSVITNLYGSNLQETYGIETNGTNTRFTVYFVNSAGNTIRRHVFNNFNDAADCLVQILQNDQIIYKNHLISLIQQIALSKFKLSKTHADRFANKLGQNLDLAAEFVQVARGKTIEAPCSTRNYQTYQTLMATGKYDLIQAYEKLADLNASYLQ